MMSDITRIAIQAPITVAMSSAIGRLQFYNIAQGLLGDFDRVTAERDALQLRLNAADQRIDDLEGALREILHNYNHGHLQHTHKAITAAEELIEPAETERDIGIPGTSFQRLNMLANQGE